MSYRKKNKSKHALVVEGGAMRGVFSAGVLAAFGRESFDPFDLYIGVSAGACNLASHLAQQNDRNMDIVTRYSSSSRFINYFRFLRGGHLMDLDWLWDVTISEYRLDLQTLFRYLKKNRKDYFITVTSMKTGKPLYLRPDERTLEDYLKVSSSVPILYRGRLDVDGEPATDGGVADSIPVREARRRGAELITVIRSRPEGYIKKGGENNPLYTLLFRKYPEFTDALNNRANDYMESIEFIKNPPPGIQVHDIAPPPDLGVSRTTRNKEVLRKAYETGLEYGYKYMEQYKKSINIRVNPRLSSVAGG